MPFYWVYHSPICPSAFSHTPAWQWNCHLVETESGWSCKWSSLAPSEPAGGPGCTSPSASPAPLPPHSLMLHSLHRQKTVKKHNNKCRKHVWRVTATCTLQTTKQKRGRCVVKQVRYQVSSINLSDMRRCAGWYVTFSTPCILSISQQQLEAWT